MVICKVSGQLLRMNNRSRYKLIIGIEFSYNGCCSSCDGIITNI
jgi:hypothetical protein